MVHAKKKLTDDELFLYDICRELRIPHPDYLGHWLTWRHVGDWQQYTAQKPWGEYRADLRSAVQTLWIRGVGQGEELPSLMYPYFQDREEQLRQIKEAEKHRQAVMSPEMQAKLKAMRQKHAEQKRT